MEGLHHPPPDNCRWHGELEAARTSETEEKYRRYAATLEAHLNGCQQILDKVSLPCESPLSAAWRSYPLQQWCSVTGRIHTAAHSGSAGHSVMPHLAEHIQSAAHRDCKGALI